MDQQLRLQITRKIAQKHNLDEMVIKSIINHQFISANVAFGIHKSVELSGLGKFLFNQKKAEKRMAKLLSQKELFERYITREDLTEAQKRNYQFKLNTVLNNIKHLKPKML